jgi:Fe-S cluster assembly iron-binding protein IscA
MDGITDRAGDRLKKALDDAQAPPEKCVRYRVTGGGAELKIDTRDPLDLTFEYGGRTVLIVDTVSAETVAGQKLDFKDGGFCLV